jgi:hypothetical protein
MAAICYSSIKGLAMRATRLDSVGKWATGATASAISDGFVSIQLSANIEEGTEFQVKNANGDLCINEKDASRLKWFDLTVDFCEVDPDLYELMTGMTQIDDYASNAVGYEIGETLPSQNFSLEVWTAIAGATGYQQYVYWVLPMVTNAIVGDYQIGYDAMTFQMKANSQSNVNWGKGPYNVQWTSLSTPGKMITNIGSDTHLRQFATEVAPPSAVCGYVTQSVAWTAPV